MVIATKVGFEVVGGNKNLQFNKKDLISKFCVCVGDYGGSERYQQYLCL